MKPNTKFNLDVKDLELIEEALRKEMRRLNEQRLTLTQSTIKPVHKIDSVKEIDSATKEINNLLGKLHNQKNWYRPKEDYVSG
jgi:hypothetical protein